MKHDTADHIQSTSTLLAVHRVAACVCTCRRPQMLARCLASIAAQRVGVDIDLTIVVVDNEPTPAARQVVAVFAATCPFPVLYVHQPQPGIAAARNAALDSAMAADADWIAFIDDDETAAPGWIDRLMVPEYLGTPILLGTIIQELPNPAPFWAVDKSPSRRQRPEGERCKTGTTGNVRISAAMVRAGFRFDETLGLMGGEDNELFTRARLAGFEIRRTRHAVVTETSHPERLTYRGQMYRAYWCAASEVRRKAIAKGWPGAILRMLHTVPISMLFGAVELVAAPLFAPVGLTAFKRRALAGGKKIAKGAGRAAAMIGRLPAPYARIVGH